MAAAPANPQQPLINTWLGQLVGTMVLAGVVMVFFRTGIEGWKGIDAKWQLYALYAGVAAIIPALLYLTNFKQVLDVDRAAQQANGGRPDPAIRKVLVRALTVGGALCELPQSFGVLHLLLGGETRWFLGATMVTIALRLSYRPFERKPR
ncbi:hypothetical protein BWI17_17075 [Betaproteobacteria bacterium GR16-43]|nr:hypothetical protein BWI17_17075 [Betaproteobacteria bacterium GR16-43]